VAGATVANVGTGDGELMHGAVDRVGAEGDVLAIDASVDTLEALRAATSSPNISYFVGQADVLPLTDGSVDAVVSRALPADAADAFREFSRVLVNGGRVSLLGDRPQASNADSMPDLERWAMDAGFTDVTLDGNLFLSATKR
jgi:arsenite methyltransferase